VNCLGNGSTRTTFSTDLKARKACWDSNKDVFHTYSCYARGVDMLNGAYYYLDLVPKGRDEAGHSNPQFWVRRHDECSG
jgi:predicted dithiol-disulfide oxidoreductase (DUF899 family)